MVSLPQFVNTPHQFSQRHRCKQHRCTVVDLSLLRRRCHRQICPDPRQRLHDTVAESHQHPRDIAPPEDATDTAAVTAGRTLFRHDRECGPTKCNIRCSVSLA
jgi:hypothetical protein